VIAGFVSMLVVALTLFGTLNELSPAWRGLAQALGSLAGVYLGSQLQAKDMRQSTEGASRAAIANLVALASGIRSLIETNAGFRNRLLASPPRTVDSYSNAIDSFLRGIDGQAISLLAHARAAAQAWLPFVPDGQEYVDNLVREHQKSSDDL
jgi:hypothetical protein